MPQASGIRHDVVLLHVDDGLALGLEADAVGGEGRVEGEGDGLLPVVDENLGGEAVQDHPELDLAAPVPDKALPHVDKVPVGAGVIPADPQGAGQGRVGDGGVVLTAGGHLHAEIGVSALTAGPDGNGHVDGAPVDAPERQLLLHGDIGIAHPPPMELVQLPDGVLDDAPVPQGQLPGQSHLAKPLVLRPGHAGVPILHPRDDDPPPVRG